MSDQLQLQDKPVPSVWTPDQKLMALSWKQPYAELMLYDKIETRTWATKYRGWVMICASKAPYTYQQTMDISGYEQVCRIIDTFKRSDWNQGHTIAIGYLSDCRPMTPADTDAAFVQYRSGLWCHVYTNIRAITPLPWKGSQGWREVPQDFKNQIKF